jgi:RNA polymerase-binding transcription factor DksA
MKQNEAFIEEMKQKLLEEKKRIEKSLGRFAKPTEGEGAYETQFEDIGREPEDNAHEVETYQTDISLEKTLEGRLEEIIQALGRIEKGTYGISEVSGKPIPEDRLRAFPEAKTCAGE